MKLAICAILMPFIAGIISGVICIHCNIHWLIGLPIGAISGVIAGWFSYTTWDLLCE